MAAAAQTRNLSVAKGGTSIMSETTKSAPAAGTAAQAPTLTQMPACADTSVADVIRDIFKQKDIALTKLSDLKLGQ